jgi:hypothetical protein
MNTVRMLALLVLCTVPLACRSSSGAAASEVPCTCGEPTTDIEGCAHSSCLKGERNPDNPDCVCGSLSIPKK